MIVKVPQFPWYGDTELELEFPSAWKVITCQMVGQDAPKISDEKLEAAFLEPIGTPRIAELARGKKEVVIIFDDLSRPTKVAELVPYVLRELKEGGVKDENIQWIRSAGAYLQARAVFEAGARPSQPTPSLERRRLLPGRDNDIIRPVWSANGDRQTETTDALEGA